MSEEKDKLLDHDYDGIQELDNDLPRWWLWLFILTIIWAVVYLLYFHVFDVGYLQADEYKKEMNPNYVRVSDADSKFLGVLPDYHNPYYSPKGDMTPRLELLGKGVQKFVEETKETDTVTYVALTDETDLKAGKAIFVKNCVQCHGAAGQGLIGPNLTDKYWIHPADFSGIVKSIKYGYPAKGMISWRAFLKPEEILKVASYVKSLKGSNPPNAKAPQGDIIVE